MKREEQTDEIKLKLWSLVNEFVNKWWPTHYPQFRGGSPTKDDLYDLAADFYTELLTPKGRGDVKESFLDKWDPDKVHDIGEADKKFAALVKIMVIRKLIDRARSDKGEIRYNETYSEDTPDRLSLDFLSMIAPKGAMGVRNSDPESKIREALSSPEYKGWKYTTQGLFDPDGKQVAEDESGAIEALDIDMSGSSMNPEEDLLYVLKGLNKESLKAAKARWKDKPKRARNEVVEDYELYKDQLDPKVAEFIEKVIYDSRRVIKDDVFSDLVSTSESDYDDVYNQLSDLLYENGNNSASIPVENPWDEEDLNTLRFDLSWYENPPRTVKVRNEDKEGVPYIYAEFE